MRSRIMVGLILGALGGFIGWLLQENLIHYQVFRDTVTGAVESVQLSSQDVRILMFCVGGLTGMSLGIVDGVIEGNTRKIVRGGLTGLFGGFIFGFMGINIGNYVFNLLGGSNEQVRPEVGSFVHQIVARSIGWAFMGLGIGAGSAISTISLKRMRNGAIGGFIGGFIGGVVFLLVSLPTASLRGALGGSGMQEVGGPGRMIGFTVIGALTGLFIGIVDELLKEAWVRVLAGKNEGKDIILSKPMNIIGRDERCVVPLYGDISVGIQHAAIRADGNRHVLIDAGTSAGTLVNGQRAEPNKDHLLRDGDMLQIGRHRVLFRERSTASKVAQPPADLVKPVSPGSSVVMPSHLCPFCGSPKDAAGRCLCSVASAGSAGSIGQASMTSGSSASATPYGTPVSEAYSPAPFGGGPADFGAGAFQAPPAAGQFSGVDGAYAGQVFFVSGVNMTVGREAGCDLLLSADPSVSRNHARVVNENGQFVLYDNGSSNGTFVNGQRVAASMALAPGDLVQFGASKFQFA